MASFGGDDQSKVNLDLTTIKQEIFDDEESITLAYATSNHDGSSDIDKENPCKDAEPWCGPSTKLADLVTKIELKEYALQKAWVSLAQTLSEYKAELKLIKDISSSRNLDFSAGKSEQQLIEEHRQLKIRNEHLDKQLKECRHELKEKELTLVSKVCQLGLMEAKLVDTQNRCALLSNHLIKAESARSKTMEVEAANVISVLGSLSSTSVLGSDPSTSDDVRQLITDHDLQQDGTPPSSQQLNSAVMEALPPSINSETARMPRRRGRPPGPGRDKSRLPLTVSMMMRGLGTKRRRRGGRTVSMQHKPRYISEMIAASERTAQSVS